ASGDVPYPHRLGRRIGAQQKRRPFTRLDRPLLTLSLPSALSHSRFQGRTFASTNVVQLDLQLVTAATVPEPSSLALYGLGWFRVATTGMGTGITLCDGQAQFCSPLASVARGQRM